MPSAQFKDLTLPIENHFRWKVDREKISSFEAGDLFQITKIGWAVHGFTHIDAPKHILPQGSTSSEFALDQLMGFATVIDVSGVDEASPITAEMLENLTSSSVIEERILLKAAWDSRISPTEKAYWQRSPYLTRCAAEWLLDKRPKLVGFDFPQDYPIRGLLENEVPSIETMVTHDLLLRNGIPLLEYLCNMASLNSNRVELIALPLKILDSDGAPIRVIAKDV